MDNIKNIINNTITDTNIHDSINTSISIKPSCGASAVNIVSIHQKDANNGENHSISNASFIQEAKAFASCINDVQVQE
jgi:hypothetical protein